MARDFQLWLSTGEGEPHSLDAPTDISTADFLVDVRESLNLPDGRWVVYDKALGRELNHSRTLSENGVEDGHQLFIRRVEDPEEPIPPMLPPDPVVPTQRPWLFPAAILLTAVAFSANGYYFGTRRTSPEREKTVVVRETVEGASPVKLEEALRENAELKTELEKTKTQLEAKQRPVQSIGKAPVELEREIAAMREANAGASRQISTLSSELSQSRAEANNLRYQAQKAAAQAQADQAQLAKYRDDVERLESTVQRLRSESGRAQPTQPRSVVVGDPGVKPKTFAASGTMLWSGRISRDEPVVIDDGRPSSGGVRGDPLPGVPIQVSIVPEGIGVAEFPRPENGWKRIALRSNSPRNIIVTIQWNTLPTAR